MGYLDLDDEERFIYMWQHQMLGGFKARLVDAIAKADNDNLAKLALGFPVEVAGYKKYSTVEGWWEGVMDKLNDSEELSPCCSAPIYEDTDICSACKEHC